jgi:aminoglycoside 6'-N-acetyltransferase
MRGFEFRPLTRADFPLLCHWLAQPQVQRWWADDASPRGVEEGYGGAIDGADPCEVFLAVRGDEPVGLIQRLRLSAYPQYLAELAPILAVPENAWSIDYLVGETTAIGRGLGTEMIRRFSALLWRDAPQAQVIIVPVHAGNRHSWRALERAGYRRAASGQLEPDNSADNLDHHIYRLDRP